jgi:hypothetical protein
MTVKDMENKHISTIFAFQEDVKVEKVLNNKIVRSKECCLTCGKNSRIQFLEKVDGKQKIKEACLYCICRVHTASNRERD